MNKGNRKASFIKEGWLQTILLGAAILTIAAVLRTYNIFSTPIFADEAIYIRWAQVMRAEPQHRFLPQSDGKQPLFMWLVIPALKVFSDPLVAGRMVSVFSAAAAIVGVFLVALALFGNRKLALVCAAVWAVSPFSVFFDRMALVDSLLTTFGIWSLLLAVMTAKTLRLDMAILAGFALGAAWLTKSPAVFFLLLLPSTALLVNWQGGSVARARLGLALLGLWLVSWIVAFGMYNILRLGPNFHMIDLRNRDYVFTVGEALQHPLDPFQFHIKEIVQWFWVLLPGTVLISAAVGLVVYHRKYFRQILLLLTWAVFPLLVQAEFAKVFTARYLLFTAPPIFVIAAAGLAALPKKWFWAALSAGLAIPLYMDYLIVVKPESAALPARERSGYFEEWTAGVGIREVAQYVKQERINNPQQKIVVGTEGFFGTLPDGLQIYLADIPGIVVKGVGISISSVHESLIDAKRAGDRVFLVVNDSRLTVEDPETVGMAIIKTYPKAVKPDGTRDSLLLLEVGQEAIKIFQIKNAKKVTS